jgi:ATP-dependent DNA helicase RecG
MDEREISLGQNIAWLKTAVQYAKGVGPHLSKVFARLNIHTFEDVLYHLPFRYLDRRQISAMNMLQPGKNRCVTGEVYASGIVSLGRRGKRIFEVILTDGSGHLTAKWFNFSAPYFQKRFKKGEKFLFFGEVTHYRGEKQMVHPEVETVKEFFDEGEVIPPSYGLVPVYHSTEGLYQRQIRRVVSTVLTAARDSLGETLSPDVLKKFHFPALYESFSRTHRPENSDSTDHLSNQSSVYHRRLAFDEFFYLQLGLGLKKRHLKVRAGFSHQARYQLRDRLLSRLPFELTESQKRAVQAIAEKMCLPEPMNCLLQGDVGSGKTLVGVTAALLAVENACQVAFMVPTEILAEQHFSNLKKMLHPLGVHIELLTSSNKASERRDILRRIAESEPMILVGTHAILEQDVSFARLSLVIIDEQHRFGVRQRMELMNKGRQPDVLVMTATPIPRSLSMTLYGDLDLCLMTDMPRGRKPIYTRVMYEKNRPKLLEFVRKKIQEGRQAYFVFPLIEESEKMDLKDATQAHQKLQKEFPEFVVALIHGRMKAAEKEEIMRRFSEGIIHILVATTVIEVGIDVANATMMVIEHAERFGLSQLHQLRGRVGRGSEKSYCILATGYRQTSQARERLKVMEGNADGFMIAEEDLKIRGPGDFLGTRQSGMPDLRVANLVKDLDLLEAARLSATEILDEDPELRSPGHRGMRQILDHRWSSRLGLATVG